MINPSKKLAFIEGLAFDIVNRLKQRCPVDNGQLRSSINFNVSGNTINISMLDYGVYVEFGTPPHVIRPKNRKSLKFEAGRKARLESGGKNPNMVFAKEVKHPGTRPQPFIRPTFRDDLTKIIADNAARHLR